MEPDDPRHGTANGYNNLKCRCPECKAAWSDYMKLHPRWRAMRYKRRAQGLTARGKPFVSETWCRKVLDEDYRGMDTAPVGE